MGLRGEPESGELVEEERMGVGDSDWEVEEEGETGERGRVRTEVVVGELENFFRRTPRLRRLDIGRRAEREKDQQRRGKRLEAATERELDGHERWEREIEWRMRKASDEELEGVIEEGEGPRGVRRLPRSPSVWTVVYIWTALRVLVAPPTRPRPGHRKLHG